MTKIVKILQEVRHNNHGELVQFQAWKIKFAKLQQNLMQRKKILNLSRASYFLKKEKSNSDVPFSLIWMYRRICARIFWDFARNFDKSKTGCKRSALPAPIPLFPSLCIHHSLSTGSRMLQILSMPWAQKFRNVLTYCKLWGGYWSTN